MLANMCLLFLGMSSSGWSKGPLLQRLSLEVHNHPGCMAMLLASRQPRTHRLLWERLKRKQ
jgi:hypothetical protein